MKKLAIILNIQSNLNPLLLYCFRELSDLFEITVISADEFQKSEKYPHIAFINYSNYLKWSERILRIVNEFIDLCSTVIEFVPKFFNPNFKFNYFRKLKSPIGYLFIQRITLPLAYTYGLSKIKDLSGVICIDAASMTAARWLKKLKKIPYLYWVYEIYPNQSVKTPKLTQKMMEAVEGEGCQNADLVVVTSNIWAKLLRRRYKVFDLKHKVVCVCPPRVNKFADLELSDKVKFYYHGIYIAGRGLENLIYAMQIVEGGVLYLRGIGDDFEKFLREETDRLKLNEKVKFLPPVPTEQLAEEATRFDVGVMMVCMTTFSAKFLIGFKTFENISAGLPLFSPRSYQLGEIIKKNKVGVIYPNCGVDALAETLQYCVSNKEKIRQWKLNARKYAEREINPEYQKRQLLEAIDQVISKNKHLSN